MMGVAAFAADGLYFGRLTQNTVVVQQPQETRSITVLSSGVAQSSAQYFAGLGELKARLDALPVSPPEMDLETGEDEALARADAARQIAAELRALQAQLPADAAALLEQAKRIEALALARAQRENQIAVAVAAALMFYG